MSERMTYPGLLWLRPIQSENQTGSGKPAILTIHAAMYKLHDTRIGSKIGVLITLIPDI